MPVRVVKDNKQSAIFRDELSMLFKRKGPAEKPADETGKYRVQLFSRRAALIKEFCLDAAEIGLTNIEDAEEHLRQTLSPTESAALTVALFDESPDRHHLLQFDIESR